MLTSIAPLHRAPYGARLTIHRGQQTLLLFNAYNDVIASSSKLHPNPASLEQAFAPTLDPTVAPTVPPVEFVPIDLSVLNAGESSARGSVDSAERSAEDGDICTTPLRVIYLPRERATRGITDRITRILALVSVGAVTRSVLHIPAPRYFVGTRHNRRIPKHGVTEWWDGYLNLTALDAKVKHVTGWYPCGGLIQRANPELNYTAWMDNSSDCVQQWALDPEAKPLAAGLEEQMLDVCGVQDLDDFAQWFRPIVPKGFLWYTRTRGLFRAAHAGAYPMSQRLVDAAFSVAKKLGWPETKYVALKLRLKDKAKYVANVDCTSARQVSAKVHAKLNRSSLSNAGLALPLFLMSDETNATFLGDLRARLVQIPYISSVFMERDFAALNQIRLEEKDEPGGFLAALLVHRLAAFRFVTFERERFEGEEELSQGEGILPAKSSEVLCPGVVNRFRRWHHRKHKRKRKRRQENPSRNSSLLAT